MNKFLSQLHSTFRLAAPMLLALSIGCASSSDYYRERALLTSRDVSDTYSVEKRELKLGKNSRPTRNAEAKQAPILTGTDAVTALREGNNRFLSGEVSNSGTSQERRTELSHGQSPHTAVFSCSDSRVAPERVFDQGMGELFVVRTAGEVADAPAVASLEYAVEHLGVKSILVLGHTSCGAVKTALSVPKGQSAGSKDLDSLLNGIRPNLKGFTLASAGPGQESAVRAQVDGAAKQLLSRSKLLKHAVEKRGLIVVRGIYHLDTGKVDTWY